jgi:hypothetical protein
VTSPLRQLGALLALRWQMLRTPGAKLGTLLAAVVAAWVLHQVVGGGEVVEQAVLATAIEIAPAAYLGFGLLALVAPLTAGGGHHVVPPGELVAFPVRATTHFFGGLLLAPLNLVWALQLLVLLALTSYLTLDGSFLVGATTTAAYVSCLTVAGQAAAWLVVGARQTRTGRRVVTALGGACAASVLLVLHTGSAGGILDRSPTGHVVRAVSAGGGADVGLWLSMTAGLLAATALGLVIGTWICSWSLRRPSDAWTLRYTSPVRRRDQRASPLRELVAVDRASVWRAPALRRGGLVLLLLPGAVAVTVPVPWESLVVLPGLVAAGAGLLFGINAFALDASGSVWLASLPVEPRLLVLSKLVVMTETVLAAVTAAALAGAVRAPAGPSGAQLAAVVGSALACTFVVVALSLSSSVRRPHKADLLGPRDAVAPPGALAASSIRLAVPCALVGTLIASSSYVGVAWFPLVLAAPILLTALLSIMRSVRRWEDPVARARVVQVVATG